MGLPSAWAGLLRDWDRTLRAGNYPATTRYNYLLGDKPASSGLHSCPGAVAAELEPAREQPGRRILHDYIDIGHDNLRRSSR
jgi:hypothetical protein